MTNEIAIRKDRLWDSIQTLGRIGETDDGAMMRVTGSDADRRARDRVVEWFRAADMDVAVDPVGNVVARRAGRVDAPPVVTGSHIDTVPAGGKFDGTVGVLGPLEIVRAWNAAGLETDRPIHVVVFTEEEGTRFGTGLLGSLVATGRLRTDDALALEDEDGVTLAETLREMGYDGRADLGLSDAAAFIEMHVEQGPVLDRSDTAVGVVETVAGITHHRVTFEGEADHAGNTPMEMRRDAYAGAAEFTLELERTARRHAETSNTVGTVGKSTVAPNGTNVIPGRVDLGVDIRDTDGEHLRDAVSSAKDRAREIASRRELDCRWRSLLDVSPTAMSPEIIRRLIGAVRDSGYDYRRMLSGAGHDAMNVAAVAPTGLLFVPSRDGVSHSPAEYTSPEDLYAGTRVLEAALRDLATSE
ncbi:Zn-dependent hydrolase [Halomarina halobia]|uniref:Zn-dependent hydrolase n=1 Tax=Halomarina halobia TaxID=3033386 RepID=A0ABD6ADB5_9EURY|nr:Zn-dependent hydrolase [Halomarina sp. PSR21]